VLPFHGAPRDTLFVSAPMAYFCRQCDNIHCFAANRHILGRHAYATAEAAQSICDYIIEMWNGDALLTSMATVGLCCTNHRQRHISADGTAGPSALRVYRAVWTGRRACGQTLRLLPDSGSIEQMRHLAHPTAISQNRTGQPLAEWPQRPRS